MKGKLIGFALAVLSVATIGVVQLTSEALKPGQVGSSPTCTVNAIGARGNAFAVASNTATVKFKVSGAANCRVQLSGNSFYAPAMDGRPYNKQILFKRVTKTYTRGTYAMSVALPTSSTKSKGCYYQVDLTYGTHNVTPVLAYGHGKVPCGETPQPRPSAVCKNLTVKTINRTTYSFFATSEVKNGAKVTGYDFTVSKDGAAVKTLHSGSTAQSGGANFNNATPGTYTVKVVVKTSLGDKSGSQCTATFTVPTEEVKQTAVCKALTVETITNNEKYQFNASAEVTGGATISGYEFTIYDSTGEIVDTQSVASSDSSVVATYTTTEKPGDYRVKVVVKTSLGDKNGSNCEAPFTIDEKDTPGIEITKYVENVKYKRVGVNAEYEYEVAVRNTGNVNLINAVVTDTPDVGIELVSASNGDVTNNTWTYTIPELKVGETMNFTLKAKVPIYMAGMLKNTVCVDATEVPGSPDDCDSADVDVPTPGKTEVCNPETGKTITVDESDADKYVPVGSEECETTPVTPPEEEAPTPEALPQTGPADVAMQLFGATSLAGAGSYYLASRRQRS